MSIRNALKVALAILLAPIVMVFEGGRWITRTLTNSHPLPVPVSDAEDAALAALEVDGRRGDEDAAFENQAQGEWKREANFPWAVRVKEHLWALSGEWRDQTPDISVLPPAIHAWLHGLTPEQRERVVSHTHLSDLERHLRGHHHADLPHVLSESEVLARAEAAAAERQATLDILQSLIDDEPPVRRAA
ncbi:hypothetical protein ASF36_23435 [Methylobacterium sp. Leaf90]|nr:hypothetical protein ASF36_23435 [Methylobacterium sp. Leaf90]